MTRQHAPRGIDPGQVIDRDRIVSAARAWIGTPYRHQASLRGIGADCLGLVLGVWRDLYGTLPEAPPAYSRDWAEASGREAFLEAARRHLVPSSDSVPKPGAVLLFRFRNGVPAKHAAIATTSTMMVHACEGHVVAEVPIAPWLRRRLAATFDFPGLES